MAREAYRFAFDKQVSMHEVRETLLLAVLVLHSLHGESCVRLDAAYLVDDVRRGCVIDSSTEIGRALARVFTGLVTREFGETAFRVSRARKGTPRGRTRAHVG